MGKARYSVLSDRARKPLIKLERKLSYLNVLNCLQDYDVLPASYLKAAFKSHWYVKNLLTPLAKAHLIEVPSGYEHNNARGRVCPLQISELGEAFLGDQLRARFKHNDDFKHKYLRSIVKYSFDRAPMEIPHLVLRTEADIKAFCTKNYGVTFDMFAKVKVRSRQPYSPRKILGRTTQGIYTQE